VVADRFKITGAETAAAIETRRLPEMAFLKGIGDPIPGNH
jgi:hypothetical protein